MVDIYYSQEKINPVIYIVPAALIAGGLLFLVTNFADMSGGESLLMVMALPLLPILFGAGILIVGYRYAKKQQQEIREIRERGRRLSGEILDIEEHVTCSSDGDGGTSKDYSYNFIVKYADPVTSQPVTAESIETHRQYELKSPECLILVHDGKVLVEKAYVEAKKNRAFIFVILFFLAAAAIMAGHIMGWF